MITARGKWHQLAKTKSSALLKVINLKHNRDFWSLNWLNSIRKKYP